MERKRNLQPINTQRPNDNQLHNHTELAPGQVVVADEEEEPLSPAARLFQAPRLSCCIITVLGSHTPLDVDLIKFGLENSLVKHPRFSSLLVVDDKKGSGGMRWRRTKVDVNNHIIVPDLDTSMELADKCVEDYISNLTNIEMDYDKPLWELHILNVETSDAKGVAVLKVHHSIGDGISLISLFLACTRKASDLESMPTIPKGKRSSSHSTGFCGVLSAIWTILLMVINTFVDLMHFAATSIFLKDTVTPIKGSFEDVALTSTTPKRIVHRIISLNDIKLVKNAMNMTINDVVLGVTMAGLYRYLNDRYASYQDIKEDQDIANKKINDHLPQDIRLRATLLFNIRPAGIESLSEMMEKGSKLKWGNVMGYVILPMIIALQDDPLDYIRKAKAIVDRKKRSFEAICSYTVGRFVLNLFGLKLVADVMHKVISNTTMSFSNVVGPQEDISFYGHHVAYIAPSVYGQPQALTIHWQSYGNKMICVVTVDPSVIPDPHKLCNDLELSLNLIKDAVVQRGLTLPSPSGRNEEKVD